MTSTTTAYDQLNEALQQGGVAACLDRLIEQLAEQNKHQELFEARKMQVRQQLGLPLLSNDLPDDLNEEQRRDLEDKLIDAYRTVYRDVGLLMFRSGELSQGWTLLQAAGEEAAAANELRTMEVNDDNMEEFVEVALNQGVVPELGFAAVLEHYGTCNAITTYDQAMYGRPREVQQKAARLLVDHIREDLIATVKADIAQQQGSEPTEDSLAELVAERDWLFSEGSYHIDTTHLASTVRIARVCEDEDVLRQAIDLTEYGRRLQAPFQYEGDEPFKDLYPSHALFFHAVLGEQVDEALEYFRERAESVNVEQVGTAAAEVYISLLARLGRYREAAEATLAIIPPGVFTQGLAPSLFELCDNAGDFQPMIRACQERDDLLGLAAGLIQSRLSQHAK